MEDDDDNVFAKYRIFYTWETSLISTNTGSKNREFFLGILSSSDGSFLTSVQIY